MNIYFVRPQVLPNNSLFISKVERMDIGHYKCVASNYLGQVSSEALINVNGNILYSTKTFFYTYHYFFNSYIFVLAPPVIISASRDLTVKTGATIELQCIVEGHPIPVVTWFKDGRSITPGPRISFHNESNKIYVLRIHDIH
jgi:hypothetical protein